jgi:hypothetical protein
MTETDDEFFIGVMLLKDGKWAPTAKFGGNSFGSALIKAEELNANREYEGVKVMRISTSKDSGVAPKEMWISPHLANQAEAEAAAKLSKGLKQTKTNLNSAHEQRKAQYRDK